MKSREIHYLSGNWEKTNLVFTKWNTSTDDQGRKYKFITNNWDITDEEVALLYKNRWSIEICFKKIKQNFQLTYFYSDTENGIKTQVWCTRDKEKLHFQNWERAFRYSVRHFIPFGRTWLWEKGKCCDLVDSISVINWLSNVFFVEMLTYQDSNLDRQNQNL